MTTAQAIQRARAGIGTDAMPRWSTALGLGLLCALSLWLRTRVLGAGFWIDEGISVGIAHHPLTAIPHLLREDGSPPLYYLLLHVWIGWFGDGERATHALSLLPALGCIPVAYWLARSIFGRTAAWICAALATVDPYLTYYGQETRMYTLAALFSLVATGAFVRGVIEGRRRGSCASLRTVGANASLPSRAHGIAVGDASGCACTRALPRVRVHG